VIEEAIDRWDGELTVVARDRPSGGWFVVAVHSTALGPSGGGCRMRVYGTVEEAVVDAHRLSAAMTRKFAVCDVPLGGGKSVIAVPRLPAGDERVGLFHRFGTFLETLAGMYSAAPDMNTSPEDMDLIGERTSRVFCRTEAAGGSGGTGPDTALGVYAAVKTTVAHLDGSDAGLAGTSVVVQGVGAVGSVLASRLAADGATVTVSDLDTAAAERLAGSIGASTVDPADALRHPCDVLSPCAAGGVLDAATIPELRCRAVVGGANNQLVEPADATRLHEAGILWAPDYVANCGGVLHGAGLELLGWTRAEVDARVAGIGATLRSIYEAAAARGVPPLDVAEALAAARLEAARPAGSGP
jgi:leucine dehydrogenase